MSVDPIHMFLQSNMPPTYTTYSMPGCGVVIVGNLALTQKDKNKPTVVQHWACCHCVAIIEHIYRARMLQYCPLIQSCPLFHMWFPGGNLVVWHSTVPLPSAD